MLLSCLKVFFIFFVYGRILCLMGLSPYSSPADAGVLCVILVNTAISISIVKELVRSILHVVGIHIASWEDYSIDNNNNNTNSFESIECRASPSESYMEEFRSRTPTIRYDSIYNNNNSSDVINGGGGGCSSSNVQLHECPVCLNEFEPDAEINHLSCGHVFHKICLEKWLKYWNVTCPLCRNYMLPQDAEENTCPM